MQTCTRSTSKPRASVHRPVVIFDGDDTLWKTQCLYDRAKAGMARLLAKTAPERDALIKEFDRFDAQRAEQIGLAPKRFMESIAMFYAQRRALASERSSSRSQKLHALTSEVLQPPKLFRGTVSSLKALAPTCRLYLMTAGDKRVQRRKVRQTGLSIFFQKVWVVPEKNATVLRGLLEAEQLRPEECWMVGNSLRSDIMPALANGLRVLHLNRGGWQYDTLDIGVMSPPLYRKVRNLGAVARIILRQGPSPALVLQNQTASYENVGH